MNKKFFPVLLLVILLLVPLIDLLHAGIPLTHDGKDHVARIANFYQNLQEGNIIPRWAGNPNWGYGHPILMFLYPLSSYIASFFHFLGFSFVDSTKLVFGAAFIASGLAMYLWLRAFLSTPAALLGGLLYTFAPYRFVDLYVRGAIGEHVAFVFPPLVLYFLYRLSKKLSFFSFAGGALSLAGLILAHNAISLMFLPIIGFYAVFLAWQKKWKSSFILNVVLVVILGFGVAAFFWMPAFFEGKYTLRDIVTKGVTLDRFISLNSLFYEPWNYGISGQFSVQVGVLHWLAVLLSLPVAYIFYKKKNINWVIIVSSLLLFLVSAALMLSAAKPVWEIFTILQKFQFPWRLLSLSVFLSSVLGAFVLSVFSQKYQKTILVLSIVAILFLSKNHWQANDFFNRPEAFYSGVYQGTTDTGESSPVWSVRFMESAPKAPVEVIQGNATVELGEKSSTYRLYAVNVIEDAKLQENTLYFPGWQVLVDGKAVPVEFQDQNSRGLMTFLVNKGEHKVEVVFKETKLRLVANIISLVSLFLLIMLGILKRKLWQN